MTREETIAKIIDTLSNEFEVEPAAITPEANIKDTLDLDSLSLVDLVAILDDEFGVKISTSDLPKVDTFARLYDYICEKQGC